MRKLFIPVLFLTCLLTVGCAAQNIAKCCQKPKPLPPPLSFVTGTNLAPATQGVAYSHAIVATGGTSCGTFPYRWTLTGGTLTPFRISNITGNVEGTDTVAETKSFTIKVSDCGGHTASKTFSLTVNPSSSPVILSTSPLPQSTVGTNDTFQFTSSGGSGMLTWTNPGGGLPPGCTLSSVGLLSCSPPTTSGLYSAFRIQVTDALLNFSNLPFNKTVVCPNLVITSPATLPTATKDSVYNFQIASTGGTGTLTWGVTGLPTGVSVNTSTGLISGTPSVYGTFSLAVTVTDSCSPSPTVTPQTATLVVNNDGLTLTNPTPLPAGVVGSSITIPLTSIGGVPGYTYSNPSSNLPTGLSISGATITGTPTTSGSYGSITLRVTDTVPNTNDGASPYTMSVTCPALTITSNVTWPNATNGNPYSFSVTASGGVGTRTWGISAQPTGLTINSSTGVVSGTPSVSGGFNPVVTVTDSCLASGTVATQVASLTVITSVPPLMLTNTTPLPAGVVGTALTIPLTESGGTGPFTYSNPSSNLPAGLSISSATITGTPTTSGNFTGINLLVTDNTSATNGGVSPYSLVVTCPALSIISSAAWLNATINQPYSFSLTASGGTGSKVWSLSGQPSGLSINSSTGLVSGTPTVSGNFSPIATVHDACLPSPTTTSQTGSLTVATGALTLTTTSPLPNGTYNVAYNQTFNSIGGTTPYTYSKASGTFPTGINLAGTTGILSGTPSNSGPFSFSITVTDNVLATNTKAFTLAINCPALTITSAPGLPTATQNVAYTPFSATSSGGVSTYTWSSTGLPSGMSISSAGVISGTPTVSGSFSPVLTVTDSCGFGAQVTHQTASLTVNPAVAPLRLTTPSLPQGTIGIFYSASLAASGGIPPYSFSNPSGPIPSWATLSSAGVISGTPSAVATTSGITLQVTDSATPANTNTGLSPYSIIINPVPPNKGNIFCDSSNTPLFPTTVGPVTSPTACMNTALTSTPSPGAVVTVAAGNFTDLQAKITAAVCGTTIKIPAFNGAAQAVYSGQLVIPATSCSAGNWITVETDQVAGLPAEGTRLTPAWVGIASMLGYPAYNQPPGGAAIFLPKLISVATNQSTIKFTAGFARWRFIGLEVTSPIGITIQNALIAGQAGSQFVLDRMYIHGGNSSTGRSVDLINQGVNFSNTPNSALIDSTILDIHCPSGTCTDSISADLGGVGSTTDGPHKLVNNFLSSSGEEVFTGGGGGNTASTDLEIRLNYLWKPNFWKVNDPSYFGTSFEVKNALEFKNTNRAWIQGNVMENTWVGQGDQPGTLVSLGSKNQSDPYFGTATSDGAGHLNFVSGVQFKSTIVSPNCATANECEVKYNGVTYFATVFTSGNQITVTPVPPVQATAIAFTAFNPGLNPTAIVDNVLVYQNIIRHASRGVAIFAVKSDGGDFSHGDQNIYVLQNQLDDLDGFEWSTSSGACCVWSSAFQTQSEFPSPYYLQHIWIKHNTALTRLSGSSVGFGPSLGFGYQFAPTGAITDLQIVDNISAQGFTNGTKGVCTGGSLNTLAALQCWDQLSGVAQNSFCFDHNGMATTTATSGSVTGTLNTAPYPATGQSPGCGFTTIGNPTVASYDLIKFTDLLGANGGDYHLLPTSPFKGAASDGTDMGADISAVMAATAGVTGPSSSAPPIPGPANWQLVSTPGGATHIFHLAFDASNNWWIADFGSGVWKSTNQGGSWTQINTGLPVLTMESIVFNSTNGDMIAGTRGSGTAHFYRLPTGGSTWTQIPEPAGFTLSGLTAVTGCLPPNAVTNRLLCGGLFGPANLTGFYSTNNGTSTTFINQGTNSSIYSFGYNQVSGDFLMGTETQGLFQSTDGVNFAAISPNSPTLRVGNIKGITINSTGVLLFSSQGGVWKCNTTNTCPTPTNVLSNPNTSAGDGLYTDSSGSIYEGHNNDTVNPISIYRSLDGGSTWQEWDAGLPTGGTSGGHQFIENPTDGLIYGVIQNSATNAGAIYRSTK